MTFQWKQNSYVDLWLIVMQMRWKFKYRRKSIGKYTVDVSASCVHIHNLYFLFISFQHVCIVALLQKLGILTFLRQNSVHISSSFFLHQIIPQLSEYRYYIILSNQRAQWKNVQLFCCQSCDGGATEATKLFQLIKLYAKIKFKAISEWGKKKTWTQIVLLY